MGRQLNAWFAKTCLVAGVSSVVTNIGLGQDASLKPRNAVREEEPAGRDVYIPYAATPGLPREKELQNVEQVKILAEMNRLTVELVKRRSNRNTLQADTPQLVRKLKELAKKLRDPD